MASAAVLFGTASLTASLADVGSAVPSSFDWNINFVRCANITGSAVTVDVLVTDGTTTLYLCKGYPVPANGVINIVGPDALKMPTGWKFRALASAISSINITVSGTRNPA